VSKPRRRRARATAAAALFLIALVALSWFSDRFTVSIGLRPSGLAVMHYESARNQATSIVLSDGTTVSLDADSSLDVAFAKHERLVTMRRGQAFFVVARNPSRPFVVQAGDRRVTAVGTQFQVRLDPDRFDVVLAEGKVSIERAPSSLLDSLTRRSARIELQPDQRLSIVADQPAEITHVNAEKLTSWRRGWLVFDDDTLATAVSALNRYATSPIVIFDESVEQMRLSGVFHVDQPDRFVALIQELLPVRAVRGPDGETQLLRVSPPGHAASAH
jgi:transmembrane sensor